MREQISCHRKAFDLLSRRSHFERELERKLQKRGYEADEIADTLERLRGENFLDDRRTAREFIQSRLARAPEGRFKLKSELARRGVDSEIVDEALTDLLPDNDLEMTREAAERWRRRTPRAQTGDLSQRDQAALVRHLSRRGFTRHAIFSVLQDLREEAAAGHHLTASDDPFPDEFPDEDLS